MAKHLDTCVAEAEILWTFKLTEEWSLRSSNNTGSLFQRMHFGEVVSKFKVAHTKISHLIRLELAAAVHCEHVTDIRPLEGTFTILLHETANGQVKKQYDFLTRYWSTAEDKFEAKYVTLRLFPHTSADHLMELVFNVMNSCRIPID